jgi:sodium-dependent dicarboxylate transporter 2/3/5
LENISKDERLKPKFGFFLGIIAFLTFLFLPPASSMYLPAIYTVLKHSHQEVINKLLKETNLQSPEDINYQNLQEILNQSQKILVHLPSDFHKTGEKGIRLKKRSSERTINLKKVIEIQTRGLKHTLALALLMAVWWITEALPIPVVALLPMILLPALSVAHFQNARLPGYFIVFSPYMHRLVVLFLGGFTIAEAMKRWNLHERIALYTISLIGFSPKRIILGLMIATACISMFISNTATTAMMMPIALAILLQAGCQPTKSQFGTSLMLSIAYAASIGGIGTLIGTPPNVVLAGFAELLLNIDINFQNWLLIGLPLVVILIPITWWLLIKMNPPEITTLAGSKKTVKNRIEKLGKLKGGERNTLLIFILTACMWIFRSGFNLSFIHIPGWTELLGASWIDDSVIAMIAVLLFYLLPTDIRKWEFTLDWKSNLNIPWGTLLLFGGGITIGKAMQETGAAQYIAMHLIELRSLPTILILSAVILIAKFLSEITSNTATTTMLMPILFAVGIAIGADPLSLMIAGAVATSLVFMLPVATPPNAIVYGTDYICMSDMIKNGFVLQIVTALIWICLLYFVTSALSPLVNF